jgi:hypothetical protein
VKARVLASDFCWPAALIGFLWLGFALGRIRRPDRQAIAIDRLFPDGQLTERNIQRYADGEWVVTRRTPDDSAVTCPTLAEAIEEDLHRK